MASVAVDPPPERLSTESIPAVDLRFLSQSELVALSRCSSHAFDLRRFDDVVIPKIDRSVFNESAGSRKQTYSRLRLAPRKPDITLKPRPATESVFNDAERAENARIISLFKKLFNSDSQPDESNQLVPISVDYLQPTPGHPNVAVPVNVFADGGEQNRKRGRKPKSEKFGSLEFSAADEAPVAGVRSNAVVVYDNAEEREKELVNMNGVAVDLAELGRLEDPYGAEIRRRTEGLVSDEQLLGFMSRLGGQWGSRRRRRRIVDANEFGDALPNGWKLIIAIKKKQGNAWLFCRRYISPRGQHFASCKDVSSYLMSLCGLQDMKCTSADEHIVTPPVVKKSTFEYAEDNSVKANSVMSSFTSPPSNQEKQFLPLENVYSGYPPGAEVFKCHKCSTPYCQKEGLLHHLLSCHKRKRRKAGEPIVDDVLLKNGKYECQFCNKTFTERHCYFGHVGIHVKIYAKSVEWSSGTAAKQNGNGPIAATGVPLVVSEMQGSMLDFGAKTPSIAATDVPVISVQRNPVAGLDSELEVGNFKSQLNSVALDREQKRQVSGDHKSLLDPALDKCDALYRTDNELRKVVDTSAGKSTSSSIEEDVISDKDDDNSSASSRKTIVEDMANHEVSGSKDRQAGNVESNLKGEQVGDGNYDDYVSTGMVDHGDGIASEGSLSDSDSETTLLMDNVREVQFDEVVLHEDAAEPKCETGGDDAGNEMTGAADVQQRYSEEISAVSRGMTGVEDSMNGVVESTVKNYCVERGSEQSLFSPVDEFPTCEIEAYVENACVNSIKEPSPDIMDSQKDESTVDGGSCSTKEKITESNLFLLSGGGGDGDSTVKNRASIVSSGMLPETKDEVCKVDSFLPCIFYANQSSYENAPPNNTTVMKAEVPESDQGGNANGILFASGSNNRDRGSRIVTHNQQESIFAPLGRQTFTDESNVFATCDNILEDSQRRRVSKSILSCLSVNDHMQDITDGLHNSDNNVNAIPAGTDTLPELDKVESSRNNEVILDFVGNMGEINRSVLTSAQHGIISESSSHFSLWNEQSYSAVHTHNRGYDGTGEEVRQEQIPRSNSHSLASFQPTYDLGYNLNKSYIGTVEEFTRFDHSRDTDLMIGFNNNQARTNQHVATEDLWRSNDERVMPGSLGNSSSSQTQVSGSFRAFDILMDKGENGLFSVNEKFDGLSSFGGLRSAAVEPMEFSFLTGPSSSTQLEEPKVLSYNSAEMDQGFDSSLWFSKGTAVPNMISGHDRATMCVWCGNAFRLDSAAETQAGSIGHLCQTCKDRISGAQYM